MTSRRQFLTGKFLTGQLPWPAGEPAPFPESGSGPAAEVPGLPTNTIRLSQTAMAADFEVIFNPGPAARLQAASDALAEVARLEQLLSIYRPSSTLSQLNAQAAAASPAGIPTDPELFALIADALALSRDTEGAFDPTATRLVALWRQALRNSQPPTEAEVATARAATGFQQVRLDPARQTVAFTHPQTQLNFNAFGKGYALDRAGQILDAWFAARGVGSAHAIEAPHAPQPAQPAGDIPPDDTRLTEAVVERATPPEHAWLLHGGYSSLLARGSLAGVDGWPVGIRHPQFPQQTLATLWLKNRGLSTSGSGVQFCRHRGRKYGHLIDPRTGWPAEGMLSATVLAPTAAWAEALSTAFFVLGVERAQQYCHNHPEIGSLLIATPEPGQRAVWVACGLTESDLMFPDFPTS
ncbi:MAG: FAD:protein FMN transferase [Planctomycetaceae bacterium]